MCERQLHIFCCLFHHWQLCCRSACGCVNDLFVTSVLWTFENLKKRGFLPFRRILFKNSAVMSHEEGIGDAAFDWRAAQVSDTAAPSGEKTTCTQSLFTEPVQWMQNDISQIEGKVTILRDFLLSFPSLERNPHEIFCCHFLLWSDILTTQRVTDTPSFSLISGFWFVLFFCFQLSCPKCAAKLGSFNWSGQHLMLVTHNWRIHFIIVYPDCTKEGGLWEMYLSYIRRWEMPVRNVGDAGVSHPVVEGGRVRAATDWKCRLTARNFISC